LDDETNDLQIMPSYLWGGFFIDVLAAKMHTDIGILR